MEQSPTIGALVLALSKAQGRFEGAAKSSENPFFKSRYADLHECIEAAKGPLSENELAVIQTTDTDERGIWVYTTLAHSSGEWIRGKILMKPKKDDDQSTGSSITYGRRYTFAAIVGLAQKDDDGNESVKAPKDDKKGKASPPQGQQSNPAAQGDVTYRGTVLDAWKNAADANAKTIVQLWAWRKGNQKKIDATQEAAIINSYIDQLEKSFTGTEPPEMIHCPEAKRDQVKADCEGSACQSSCPAWQPEPVK